MYMADLFFMTPEGAVLARPVAIDELAKGAGGIGCLTGVLHREEAA